MTGFDFAVAGILLVSMALGLWRGLIYEVMALLGWPVAFVLSRLYAGDLASLLPVPGRSGGEGSSESYALATYVLVFVAVLLGWAVLTRLLSRLLKKAGAGWTDRVLGGLFGILRGGLVLLALVWLAGLTNASGHPVWREALVSRALEDAALLTRTWLPDDIAQRVHFGIRS